MAWDGLEGLVSAHAARGYSLSSVGVVLGSGRPDYTLKQALATHAAMHGAEGWLFREALTQAVQDCGLRPLGVPERSLYLDRAAAFGVQAPEIVGRIGELGREIGPPWTADQKLACAAAWLALALAQRLQERP